MSNRYARMFRALAERGDGAFVPFAVLGDPDPAKSSEVVRALVRGGADALELGIPFSDPVADGPIIQAADVRALAAGTRPRDAWRIIAEVRREAPDLPIGLLVYANLLESSGTGQFYAAAAEAGVDSVVVADVPTVEAPAYAAAARGAGILPVLIATPQESGEKLRTIAALAAGYTYVVTRAGVTGADNAAHLDQGDLLGRLWELGAPPPVVGFGISQPAQVGAALEIGAAGVISGSAVVSRIAEHLDDSQAMVAALEGFVAEMKAATVGRLTPSAREAGAAMRSAP